MICDECAEKHDLKFNILGGTLKLGDIVAINDVLYYSWSKFLWYHMRYMRHNNPMFKPAELRQFVVTGLSNGETAQIEPR